VLCVSNLNVKNSCFWNKNVWWLETVVNQPMLSLWTQSLVADVPCVFESRNLHSTVWRKNVEISHHLLEPSKKIVKCIHYSRTLAMLTGKEIIYLNIENRTDLNNAEAATDLDLAQNRHAAELNYMIFAVTLFKLGRCIHNKWNPSLIVKQTLPPWKCAPSCSFYINTCAFTKCHWSRGLRFAAHRHEERKIRHNMQFTTYMFLEDRFALMSI